MIGKRVLLPIADIEIPVIADEYVDPTFGTGVVKITPAHDANDFDVGRRHSLAMPVVIDEHGMMREVADADGRVPRELLGIDRFEARERVVAMLKSLGRLERTETHQHNVRHCYRCDTVVEPRLSDQWFVRMAPLAEPALEGVRSGRIRLLPEKWIGVYEHWMSNIRDWNISRQLWWGHRVPVWYCADCDAPNNVIVAREDPASCPHCGGPVRQDEDVLDTWFSSWLWPISTLGWPNEQSMDLRTFYPTDVLVTAPEILFFWVARMIMSGLYFMGDVPYTHMYLHGTVRDTQHRKMSKSLGNGIDPLEVVERYGADALRYSLVSGMSVGTDVILDPNDLEASFAAGRTFANKLWNAGRFILSNLDRAPRPLAGGPRAVRRDELTLADRWIIARCEATVREATEAYEKFRLNEAAGAVYRFLWSDLADWYIEQIKPRLYGDVPGGDVARAVATQTFDVALRLLHPVMPFVTEALWRRFPGRPADASISMAPWPRADARAVDPAALADFGLVQQVVGAIRAIRAEYGVQPGHTVRAYVATEGREAAGALEREQSTVVRLAKLSELILGESTERVGGNAVLPDGTAVFVPLGDAIDVGRECSRLGAESDRLAGLVASQEKKLGNQQFVSRAPADVVEREREKLVAWAEQRQVLIRKRELLGCG
jgi:valyl-tRNA synthetase